MPPAQIAEGKRQALLRIAEGFKRKNGREDKTAAKKQAHMPEVTAERQIENS